MISVIESSDIKVDDVETSNDSTQNDENKNLFNDFNKLSELESLD